MSDYDSPPPEDADRTITDYEDALDPEAPTDSSTLHPPREDADRPEPHLEDPAAEDLQAENAATSLDQPSDQGA